ncbi:MAG: hypothetical protein E2598_06945 [Sphingobium sp.]|nr:hypothetical protein [Sphingobium sp.]
MADTSTQPTPRPKRLICVGFRRWRQANLAPILHEQAGELIFAPDAQAVVKLRPGPDDAIAYWGVTPPEGIAQIAHSTGAASIRIEDGFVRSVGLGSDLIPPLSLVLDRSGIYFDPRTPSDLETILATVNFTAEEIARARKIRSFITRHGITKYNMEPRTPAHWPTNGRRVLLVTGQVEDDASIRFGCKTVSTNIGLLQAARQTCPDGYIVYKPHPDVMSGNRRGKMALAAARSIADHIETDLSVISCIDASDEVHVMTSLAGFDALLRGKQVVTYGQPFFAGWGLTHDREQEGAALARRQRTLTLDELVAGALLHYPIYWDENSRAPSTCEAVLDELLRTRTVLEQSGDLEKLRSGWWRRLGRKAKVIARAFLSHRG